MTDPLAAMKADANRRALEQIEAAGAEAIVPPPAAAAVRVALPNERVDAVQVVHVVRVQMVRGTGAAGDPVRQVVRFYDFEGELLAEHDSIEDLQEAASG